MIEGTVNSAYEAIIPLRLHSQNGRPRDISTVADTGFGGFLTLPRTPEVQHVSIFFTALKQEIDSRQTPGRFLLTDQLRVLLVPALSHHLWFTIR